MTKLNFVIFTAVLLMTGGDGFAQAPNPRVLVEGEQTVRGYRLSPDLTVVALFSPRRDVWTDHFVVRGVEILGLTPAGRATVRLLNMNAPRRVELRKECQRADH